MTKPLREMNIEELWAEFEAWDKVLSQPKGPGTPSNAAREEAVNYRCKVEAWIARRTLEPKP